MSIDPESASTDSSKSNNNDVLPHVRSSQLLLQDAALNVRHAVPVVTKEDNLKKKLVDWQKKTGVTCITKFSDGREILDGFLPCLRWMRIYDKSYLVQDVIAGLTVGVMIIPQVSLVSYLFCSLSYICVWL